MFVLQNNVLIALRRIINPLLSVLRDSILLRATDWLKDLLQQYYQYFMPISRAQIESDRYVCSRKTPDKSLVSRTWIKSIIPTVNTIIVMHSVR